MSNPIPHTITWFEIPVSDISRAKTFYEKVFDWSMSTEEFQGTKMAIFPNLGENQNSETMTVHGALVEGSNYTPATSGPLLYFNAGDDLSESLARVESNGGTITMPKTNIGNHGFCARFRDTEGNEVAMHSMK